MLNAHDLNSQSRFAHAQRLSEADQHRLAKIATSVEKRPVQRNNVFKDLIASIASHIRIARAQA